MNRIVEKFAALKRDRKKGFIVYIGAGDPNLAATHDLALAFDNAGVDILELGVPFSDPLADGLVNQLAAQRGLESGTTPPKLLETIAAIRKHSQIPIVLYIYFNLIHKVGLEKFIAAAAKAGVDGLLVLDLPPEESDNYEALMKQCRPLPHLSRRADDAGRPHGTHRQARQRIYLLHFPRRRDRNADERRRRISRRRSPKSARTRICPLPSASASRIRRRPGPSRRKRTAAWLAARW